METFDSEDGGATKVAFEERVADWRAVTTQWMFGLPTYKAGGTIFAVVVNDGVVLTRLPTAERERLERAFETGPFEAGDQIIESWVHVTVGADDLDSLVPYIRASHEAAINESRSVPPPDEDW